MFPTLRIVIVLGVLLAIVGLGVLAYDVIVRHAQEQKIEQIQINLDKETKERIKITEKLSQENQKRLTEVCFLVRRNSVESLELRSRIIRIEQATGIVGPKFSPIKLSGYSCDAASRRQALAFLKLQKDLAIAEKNLNDAVAKINGKPSSSAPATSRTPVRSTPRPEVTRPTPSNPNPVSPVPTTPSPVIPSPIVPPPTPVVPVPPKVPPVVVIPPKLPPAIVIPPIPPIPLPTLPVITLPVVTPIVGVVTDPVCRILPVVGTVCDIV